MKSSTMYGLIIVVEWLVILFAVIHIGGCAAVGALPSIKYCEHVKYERIGSKANIEATDCYIPRNMDLPGT
ncbi:hypothetical protein [Immundisolibacter sp.]